MSDPQNRLPESELRSLTSRRQMLHATAVGGLALGLNMPSFAHLEKAKASEAAQPDGAKADPKKVFQKVVHLLMHFDSLALKWLNTDDPANPARRVLAAYLYPPAALAAARTAEVASYLDTTAATCLCTFPDGSSGQLTETQCQILGGTCAGRKLPALAEADAWALVKKAMELLAQFNSWAYQWVVGKTEAQEVILFILYPSNWKREVPVIATQYHCKFDEEHVYAGLTVQQAKFLGGVSISRDEPHDHSK